MKQWRSLGLSYSSKKAVPVRDYIGTISNDQSLVFVVCKYTLGLAFISRLELDFIFPLVNCISLDIFNQVGAMAHGKIDSDYINDFVSGYFPSECSFLSCLQP